jgi:hypothetical protein
VLTNGLLFRGRGLTALESMPRARVTLQVSIDSATPDLHDRHRGRGTHARALAGLRTAIALGFRLRLAASLSGYQREEERNLHALCDHLGIDPHDRVIRRVARQGVADHGIVVSRAWLVPEVCVTAGGVYWHPVGATDPAMLVTADLFPLADAVAAVVEEFAEQQRHAGTLAASFPCA